MGSGLFNYSFDVVHHSLGLHRDASLHRHPGGWVQRQLPAYREKTAGLDTLYVGSHRFRSILGGDFLLHSPSPRCSLVNPLGSLALSDLSLIHISEPTRRTPISYAVFCLKKKKR